MRLVEQRGRKRRRVCEHLPIGAHRAVQQPAHIRERVERALRRGTAHTLDLVERRDNRLPAHVERLAHAIHRVERTRHCRKRRALCDVVHVGRHVPLQFRRRLGHTRGRDHPADAPARHGVGLRHAVEHNQLFAHFGHGRTDVRGVHAVVCEMLVDLVADHPDAVLDRPCADRADRLFAPDRAGRIVRRGDDDRLRALGARGLEVGDVRLEVHFGAGEHFNRLAAGELDRLGVARPVRGGDDDLVVIVEQQLECLVDGLLAAVRHHDLLRLHFVSRIAQRLRGDCLAQFGQAGSGRVAVVARIDHGLGGHGHNRLGRGEVRFAGAETDDVDAFGLHGFRLGIHGECGARRHMVDAVRQGEGICVGHGSHATAGPQQHA